MHNELLPMHPRLGRHVLHDPRSIRYALPVLPKSAIKSQAWTRRVPIFDQGQLGSCTGNAGAGWIATDDATRTGLAKLPDGTVVDEQLAIAIYSAATAIDSAKGTYPPTDTGSDGLSVAKVLQTRKLAGSYAHAFSIDAVYSALQSGPGMLGIPWYQSMFDIDAAGHIKVDARSGLAGGHEIIVPRIDVTAAGVVERIWIDNSWAASWGKAGSGYFTPAELTKLLADQGDFVQPAPAGATPAPPNPAPSPGAANFPDLVASVPGLGAWLDESAAKHKNPNGSVMIGVEYAIWRLTGDAHLR